MLQNLIKQESESLNHFFDHLDLDEAEALIDTLQECKGMIIITGIGKSALVAEKIALTMTSTGTRAFFLSPINALHGDIGIVSKDDIFIMLSKSGETDELLHLVPPLRNKGVKIIAIVNNEKSRLAKACDIAMVLPMEKELCPFDLVPTTSAATQLIFGDLLAVSLMMNKNFSIIEYAINHPAGKIGRSLTLRVKDLMLTGNDLPLCTPQDKLLDTLVELSNKKCGCVLIVDANKTLLGIFTDGDLRRALQKHGPKALDTSMQELMTKTGRSISEDKMAIDALQLMEADQKHPITVLPVISEQRCVVGLIKMHDILQSGLSTTAG